MNDLTPEELQVISILRVDKFQFVKIIKRNGKIDLIEGIEEIKTKEKIVQILKQHDYQNIEIKQASGRIVHINRTVRTKVNQIE